MITKKVWTGDYSICMNGYRADVIGRYPQKRIYQAKDDGRQRPIGIAALEDKIVQKAVVCILEQIYEVDFTGFSYGFRPGRSQHNALDAVYVGIVRKHINWILDLDLESFFDTLDHEWLEKFLEHRIADQGMLRLIKKWLRAGVSEEGHWSPTSVGTPQGAVISPFWRTSSCTTRLTCGRTNGGRKKPEAM